MSWVGRDGADGRGEGWMFMHGISLVSNACLLVVVKRSLLLLVLLLLCVVVCC